MAQVGCPDRRIERLCITCCSPSQPSHYAGGSTRSRLRRECDEFFISFALFQCLAIVGDVLFADSVGRIDFPGGDHWQLIESIRDKLLPLGDDVTIISGHGPSSTISQERATNLFLQMAGEGFS